MEAKMHANERKTGKVMTVMVLKMDKGQNDL